MASPSAGLSRDANAPPPVAPHAPPNAAGVPLDTAHLDRLIEKAITAAKSGRYALAAAFYRHAADEALRLHGETFVCTYLTLRRSHELSLQSQLEGVSPRRSFGACLQLPAADCSPHGHQHDAARTGHRS